MEYSIIVYTLSNGEYHYNIRSERSKYEVANDINDAWVQDRSLEFKYIQGTKECVAIFNNKQVLGVDIKDAMSIEEMIDNLSYRAEVLPCNEVRIKANNIEHD